MNIKIKKGANPLSYFHKSAPVQEKGTDMKWIFIGTMVLIALMDFALFVACSHLEDREQYEQWERKQKDE